MGDDAQVLIDFYTELCSRERNWDEFRENHVDYLERKLPNHDHLQTLLREGQVEDVLRVLDGEEIRQSMVIIW